MLLSLAWAITPWEAKLETMIKRRLKDPRTYQILSLSSLLIIGWIARAFEITPLQVFVILATSIFIQWIGSLMIATRLDLKSPIVTTLSLSLLLRADALWPLAVAAAIAIGSKFALRVRGKHIFNPANIGIVSAILLTDAAWTTPGQWGVAIWLAALIAGAGMFVTYRAARIDVPFIFLGVFAALVFARALWLGDPFSIPLLRLQNGALVLFAFFMISDPKTTPDTLIGRAVFAGGAALISYLLIFHAFVSDGIFYSLAIMVIIRPLIELFESAPRYEWGRTQPPPLHFSFSWPFISNECNAAVKTNLSGETQ